MKNFFALTLAAGVLVVSASIPAFADAVTGTIVAFDRKAMIIVLKDKTVYEIADKALSVPEGLKSGDKVEIDSDGEGEEGYGNITALKILN